MKLVEEGEGGVGLIKFGGDTTFGLTLENMGRVVVVVVEVPPENSFSG